MKKYVITGGAGFIGRNFIDYLYNKEPDAEVTVLDNLGYSGLLKNIESFRTKKGFRFFHGDICNPDDVRKTVSGANIVVNFAAEAAVDRSITATESFLQTNIIGVYTLLNELKNSNVVEKIIQVSTDEVYGQIYKGSFVESSELKPRNPYAASKLSGERLAYSFFETYNIPIIITRGTNTYGPWAYPEKVIPLFITNLIDGLSVPVYGKGLQVRDWLYVDDHCAAIFFLTQHGKNGEVYNVGGRQEIANIDLTYKLLNCMGCENEMIDFVNDRPGHDFRYSLNIEKMTSLGWAPNVNLDDGLEKTIKWYLSNKKWWKPLKDDLDDRFVTGYWGRRGSVG
jgi:dTDP-glucose 4,6-dehydratase